MSIADLLTTRKSNYNEKSVSVDSQHYRYTRTIEGMVDHCFVPDGQLE